MVDEVEQVVVRPVQVLDDEDDRTLLGQLLEELAPGGECLCPTVADAELGRAEADERPQVFLEARVVGRLLQLALDLVR